MVMPPAYSSRNPSAFPLGKGDTSSLGFSLPVSTFPGSGALYLPS